MRKVAVAVVVVVLVVLGLAAVADRFIVGRTEARILDEIAASGVELSPDASVEIGGVPFLTQVAAGSLDTVTLHADSAAMAGITLTDVDVAASGVGTSTPYPADQLTLVATVPPEALTEAVAQSPLADLGLDVTVGVEAGRLQASARVLGLPVEVVLTPVAAGRAIGMTPESFTIAGFTVSAKDLPAGLRDGLAGLEVPLDAIPEGLEVTAVDVVDDGLRITATGTDVRLAELEAVAP